jgi:uncharacterized protein YggL (DUF469 family)
VHEAFIFFFSNNNNNKKDKRRDKRKDKNELEKGLFSCLSFSFSYSYSRHKHKNVHEAFIFFLATCINNNKMDKRKDCSLTLTLVINIRMFTKPLYSF